MDRISRAGLTGLLAFVLALVSGYAGAVTMPQGPDNVSLHASAGIDFTSRASQWEFQQATDGAVARGAFGVGGKGASFAGGLVRNITKQQIISGAVKGARMFGGAVGWASLLAPIVWDAAQNTWMNPNVPSPDEITSLMPSNAFQYSGPWYPVPTYPDGCTASKQGPKDENTWMFVIHGGKTAPGVGWMGIYSCNSPVTGSAWYLLVYRDSDLAQCLGRPGAVMYVPDHTCRPKPSGRPATDAEMQAAIDGALTPQAAPQLAQDVHGSGVGLEAGDPQTTGPSTVPGPTQTQTQTGDAGTRTTTTENNWDVTYGSQDVYVKERTKTTVVDETGTTTVTETSTQTTGGTPPEQPPKEKAPDLCADHPDVSACAPLGSADDVNLDTQELPVTFAYSSAAGSCPAPHVVNFLGQSIEFSYDGSCTFARGIRPVVIALALLGALWLVIRVSRG